MQGQGSCDSRFQILPFPVASEVGRCPRLPLMARRVPPRPRSNFTGHRHGEGEPLSSIPAPPATSIKRARQCGGPLTKER
jgi:hypothetical protein